MDARGNWHVLAHQYAARSPRSFEDPVAGHAFSPDGVSWTWADTQPFGGTVCRPRNATHDPSVPFASACGSRERPFLVFDGQRRPTHLVSAINSVCQGGNKDGTGSDWTYTAVQQIRGHATPPQQRASQRHHGNAFALT